MIFVIIMTLITGSGASVTMYEFNTLRDCNRIGRVWVNQVKEHNPEESTRAFYTCVKGL
jgi:hypothetical protein